MTRKGGINSDVYCAFENCSIHRKKHHGKDE